MSAATPFVSLESLYLTVFENNDSFQKYNLEVDEIMFIQNLLNTEEDLYERITKTRLKEQLSKVLETLTEREERVIALRYGLFDGQEKTLDEVGGVFNVTRERIRQIEAKAIKKLKHRSRSKYLKDFLGK